MVFCCQTRKVVVVSLLVIISYVKDVMEREWPILPICNSVNFKITWYSVFEILCLYHDMYSSSSSRSLYWWPSALCQRCDEKRNDQCRFKMVLIFFKLKYILSTVLVYKSSVLQNFTIPCMEVFTGMHWHFVDWFQYLLLPFCLFFLIVPYHLVCVCDIYTYLTS